MRYPPGAIQAPTKRNLIFKYILREMETSHRDIAIDLDTSMPTVFTYIRELTNMGVIVKEGQFKSTGGRKAGILKPNAEARVAVGVDITANHVSLVKVDLLGKGHSFERNQLTYTDTVPYYDTLGELIHNYLITYEISNDQLVGVGISVPGIISADGTTITHSHALNIKNIPTARFLDAVSYPSFLINDANAACLAELNNEDSDSIVVYLSLSNSVGGAIAMNNQLFYGDNQRSGEFGHLTLVPDGIPCYCGQRGCVDSYCNAKVLSAHSGGSLSRFFELVETGKETALAVFDRYLDYLAIAVKNIRMVFDAPIIIGGYVGGYLNPYLDELGKRVDAIDTFGDAKDTIRACTARYEASAVGAALHQINAFIDSI